MLRFRSDGARAVWALAWAVCCSAWTLPALAEAAADAPRLSWRAPAGCPDEEAVALRLSDTLGTELASFGRNWLVQGQVQRAGEGQWRLTLELREPEQPSNMAARQRVLHARRCADLVEAAAVAVAIALGDAREGGAATPAPPAAPVAEPVRSAAPLPDVDLAASDVQPQARSTLPTSLHASLEAVLDTASVSGVALGGSLALGGWLGNFGLDAHGVWLPAREAQIGAGQSADFSLLAAGARGCFRFWGNAQGLGLAACGGLELGRFTAESHGLVAAGRVRDTWLAPSLGLDLRGPILGHLAARSRLELLFPLQRQTYRVDLVAPVHEIPALTVRWSLGFDAGLALP